MSLSNINFDLGLEEQWAKRRGGVNRWLVHTVPQFVWCPKKVNEWSAVNFGNKVSTKPRYLAYAGQCFCVWVKVDKFWDLFLIDLTATWLPFLVFSPSAHCLNSCSLNSLVVMTSSCLFLVSWLVMSIQSICKVIYGFIGVHETHREQYFVVYGTSLFAAKNLHCV